MTDSIESNPSPGQVAIPIIESNSRAYLLRRRNVLARVERVLRSNPALRIEIDAVGGLANVLTREPEDPIALAYTDSFLSFQNTLSLSDFFGNTQDPIPEIQTMAQNIMQTIDIATKIKEELNDCCAEVKDLLKQLKTQVNDAENNIKKEIDQKAIEVIENTSENVINGVVGESYYRYVSTTTFVPTLILLFNEKSKAKYKRRSQLKFKILKTSEEIDQAFIEKLRKAFRDIKQKHFSYGNVRINYISKDKRVRNVIYAKDKKEAIYLLEFIYPLLGHTLEYYSISETIGRNRVIFHKRKEPLDGIKTVDEDYNDVYFMELRRVLLHVSGLEKPILIYKNNDI